MTIVETTSGKIDGVEEAGVQVFRGVPYARPPVGELRLRGPRPVEPWTGVRPANDFGNWAPQNPPAFRLSGDAPGIQAEDCLTLNLWTPAVGNDRRPVMVWIHGGGFIGGSGASPLYGGRRLAARGNVVVVTVNYRLGALGFLAHPALADDDAGGACGNWGLLDQVAALAWVRDNIAAFGGDPGRVTLFGESAGGMSVCDLLALPAARGLFHRAIAQSGPPFADSIDRAEETAAKLLAELGVARPEHLRHVAIDAILAAQAGLIAQRGAGALPLVPVVDGRSLPTRPDKAITEGAAAAIPLVIGTNRDEAKMFMVADPKNRDPDEEVLQRRIERSFGANDIELRPERAIAGYRSARVARGQRVNPRELWSAIETDRMFRIGSIYAAEAHAVHQPRTYGYLFTWESPAMRGALGACHALEIPFVFGNLAGADMDRFAGSGPAAEALSAQMMDAWLAFAHDGDPSHPGIGDWPTYASGHRATLVFGPDTHVEDAPYDQERQLWESSR